MENNIFAAILSFFIPGLGQLYEGQKINKSVLFFAIAVAIFVVVQIFRDFLVNLPLGIILYLPVPIGSYGFSINTFSFLFGLYAAYDAYTFEK